MPTVQKHHEDHACATFRLGVRQSNPLQLLKDERPKLLEYLFPCRRNWFLEQLRYLHKYVHWRLTGLMVEV
jgi:hypothetical protein